MKKPKPSGECWPDGTPKSLNNVFTQAFDGQRLDVAKMATAYKNSTMTSRAVSRAGALGLNRGKITGISLRADKQLSTDPRPDVYAKAPK